MAFSSRRSLLVTWGALAIAASVPEVARASLPAIEGPRCKVTLTKLSYDTPGADDAEFIELHVEPSTAASVADAAVPKSCTAPSDAGPDARGSSAANFDAASVSRSSAPCEFDGGGALTLGDCGLSEIELVNGDAGMCDTYRTLPLSAVRVPADGYVVICALDSTLEAHAPCDVTTAGQSTLKNGFLQNGPNDGLELVGSNASETVQLGYEGGPACFGPNASAVASETGEIASGSGIDDVNVLCDGRFALTSANSAPIRAPNPCRSAESPDGSSAEAGDESPPAHASSSDARAPWVPEFAPGVTSLPDAGLYGPFPFDASYSLPDGLARPPPAPPSCAVRGIGSDSRTPFVFAVALAGIAARIRSRRRSPSVRNP